jgi:thioredoxin 1
MSRLKETMVKGNARVGIMTAILALAVVLGLCGVSCSANEPSGVPDVPVKGKVTMVDVGAKECVPCKMMAPIMEELEKEYHDTGRAAIFFIDVWKHRDKAQRFGLRVIPTQIFYDKEGREVMRHEGFMDKKSIVAVLQKLGVE